jgi:hypothetical protein
MQDQISGNNGVCKREATAWSKQTAIETSGSNAVCDNEGTAYTIQAAVDTL